MKLASIRRGFTLVELMITVVIMGMILAIALPAFRNAHLRSREGALKSDLKTYRAAIHTFMADLGCYPTALGSLSATTAPASCTPKGGGSQTLDSARWRGPYVAEVRNDPVKGTAVTYTASTGAVASSATGNDTNGVAYSTY